MKSKNSVWILTLCLGLMSTTPLRAGQQELAAAIGETWREVAQTRDQLQSTVDALSALASQKKGDLRPAYDTFVAEVSKTQRAAAATSARAKKMGADAKAHFDGWKKELDAINNARLQAQGTKRMEKVQKNYDGATTHLDAAHAKFSPFLSDLADVQKLLANDLTPAGVKTIRSTVSRAKFNLQGVRNTIASALKELGTMQKSLSTGN